MEKDSGRQTRGMSGRIVSWQSQGVTYHSHIMPLVPLKPDAREDSHALNNSAPVGVAIASLTCKEPNISKMKARQAVGTLSFPVFIIQYMYQTTHIRTRFSQVQRDQYLFKRCQYTNDGCNMERPCRTTQKK